MIASDLERTGARFEDTSWTLVHALVNPDAEAARAAMDELVRRSWPPVYGYLRRSGRSRDEAAELTQAFFTDVVLSRRLLDSADPSRGRLRTLILTALKRYVIDAHRRNAARDGQALRLDGLEQEECHVASQSSRDGDAESQFDRRWAVGQLEEALRRCEAHFRGAGRAAHWALFEQRVLRPATAGMQPGVLADAAREHGFASPADAAAAVQTVKRRMLAVLQQVVAETAADPDSQREEMNLLMSVLG